MNVACYYGSGSEGMSGCRRGRAPHDLTPAASCETLFPRWPITPNDAPPTMP
jgi:hypothetical protein